MWYVVQVSAGREDRAVELIRRHADSKTYAEAFAPCYRAARKVGGRWEQRDELLTPGYVMVDTRDPETFAAQLRQVPAFARLLGGDGGFLPLDAEEQAWLEAWTRRGDRTVPESTGRVERGRVRILSGPLVGREGEIVKVNRRKARATVRMQFMGRVKEVEMTLRILGKGTGSSEEQKQAES